MLRMVFGCISEAAILYICNIMYFSAKEKNIRFARKAAVVIARLMVSVMAIYAILFIKILVNPTGICISNFSSSRHYSGDINTTAHDAYDNLIFRSRINEKDDLCYEKTNVDITHLDNIIFSFVLNNFSENEITNDNDCILQRGLENSVMISGTEVIFYSNQYIVFVEDTIPQVIPFDEICSTNENDILTAFLEKMIDYGYWDFFEYGCDYLLKYDPNFITPYINRYATGEFTENEKNTNADIRAEYMINFSKEKL